MSLLKQNKFSNFALYIKKQTIITWNIKKKTRWNKKMK